MGLTADYIQLKKELVNWKDTLEENIQKEALEREED